MVRETTCEDTEGRSNRSGSSKLPRLSPGRRSAVPALIYLAAMPRQPATRSYGRVFDEIAEDYDRHRPTYPDVLVDRACEGIGPGAAVLETYEPDVGGVMTAHRSPGAPLMRTSSVTSIEPINSATAT